MDKTMETTEKASVGFISRLTDVDAETKTNLMNSIQYIVLAIIPVACSTLLLKYFFDNAKPESKGTVELLAEIVGQAVVTLILLFIVHKLVTSVPTYTSVSITPINYTTLSVIVVLSLFLTNSFRITDKFNNLVEKVKEMWDGKKEETAAHKNASGKVSVSQPISGRPQTVPTHQVSRADYVQTQQHVSQPPIVPPRMNNNATGENIYGGPQNTLVGADFPNENIAPEPEAFNVMGGGGFSSW